MLGSVSDCENMYRIMYKFYVNDSWKYAEKYYKEGFRIVALSRKKVYYSTCDSSLNVNVQNIFTGIWTI